MNLLSGEGLNHSFTERVLFKQLNFGIGSGEKLALVGANGAGKSTLLKILAGLIEPVEGSVSVAKGIKVSYLMQQPELPEDQSAIEFILNSDQPAAKATKDYLHYTAHPESFSDNAVAEILHQMDEANAWDFETRALEVLGSLSIQDVDQKVSTMSGGQRKRVALAQMLLSEPDLLLLDEPTNHLDLQAIEWLEKFLSTANSTLMLITHDRYFLDAVCNEVVELNDQKLFRYKGSYGNFLEQKELRLSMEQSSIDKARNLMTKELEWMRRQPKARGTKARYRIDAFYDLKDKASKKLEQGKLQIEMQTSRLGRKILEIEKLGKSLGGKELIRDFSYTFRRGDRIGIIGKNGMGKSTFLNLITQALAPDNGTISIGETIKYGYYTQEPLQMNPEGRVIDEISSIADYITIGKDQQVSASKLLEMFLFTPKSQYGVVGKLSGGERRRLQLLKVLMASPNFLILDEPTNDLDIDTLNVLEDFLEQYPGCLVIVSHDRYFMDKLVDHIFVFEGAGSIRDFHGNYTDYRDWLAEGGNGVDEKAAALPKAAPAKVEEPKADSGQKKKLSFKEQKELELLEKSIASLEAEISKIESSLSNPDTPVAEMAALSQEHGVKSKELDASLERYLELAE